MNLIERIHGKPATATQTAGNIPAIVVRYYDTLWRVLTLGRTERVHGATLDLVGFRPNQALLDIGCGTGELILLADKRSLGSSRLVGLDVEPGMLAQARKKARAANSSAEFTKAGMEDIPYPDDSFDMVTSSLMLHHVPKDVHAQGFGEVLRVLRPGGKFIVADVNIAHRSIVATLHWGRQKLAENPLQQTLSKQLQEVGFNIIEQGRHGYKALSYVIAEKPRC